VPRLRRSATVMPFDADHGCKKRSRGTQHHRAYERGGYGDPPRKTFHVALSGYAGAR
jgi:hypothetical protein